MNEDGKLSKNEARAYKFFNEMTIKGYIFSKSGNWVKIDPPPKDINEIMLLGELGEELSLILDSETPNNK